MEENFKVVKLIGLIITIFSVYKLISYRIAIKNQKLPHEMPYSAKDIVNYATIAGYYFLSMNIDHAVMYNEIAYKEGMKVNRDPFDKMLVTQAKTNGMRLLTHDSLMGCFAEDCIINF